MIKEGRSRLGDADALPILLCYIVVLMGIPSQLILGPLGAAGTPAQIIGVGLLAWWLLSRLAGPEQSRISNPVKTILLFFALAILISYVAGMIRPIAFSEELKSADRAILSMLAWCGVVLVIIDGLASRASLDKMLRFVAGGATFIAVLGILQFFLKIDLAHYIHIPGLSANGSFGELLSRSTFRRVSGTTAHPIEFGAVLSCALPLVIHFARFSPSTRERRCWWVATAVVAAVLPMSVARSAMLGAMVAILYLFYTWPRRLQARMAIAGVIGGAAIYVIVPGLLGTIKGLFLDASNDPSTQGRTADYAPVIHYASARPFFGRGIGTFIPSLYRTLDNQYLGMLVETGIVGMLMFLTVFVGTGFVAGSVRRKTSDESTRDLAQSLKAGVAVLAVNSAFFDSLGFPMAAGMLFVLVGATGALWSLQTKRMPKPVYTPVQRRRAVVVSVATLAAIASFGAWRIISAVPQYQALSSVVLVAPATGQTAFSTSGRADYAASVLHDVLVSDAVRRQLRTRGVTNFDIALGNASLMPDSDVFGSGGPTLRLLARSGSSNTAQRELATLLVTTRAQLDRLQARAGVPPPYRIHVDVLGAPPPYPVYGRPSRAKAMFAIVLLVLAAALARALRRRSAAQPSAGSPRAHRPRIGRAPLRWASR